MNDVVQLYCSEEDIKPQVLLKNYLSYIGLFVNETNFNNEYTLENPLVNIVVLSKSYHDVKDLSFSNTIFICKDNYIVENILYCINYNDDMNYDIFLRKLSHFLSDIIKKENIDSLKDSIFYHISNISETIQIITENYINYDIFLSTLLGKYVLRDFYESICCKLSSFSSDLSKFNSNLLLSFSQLMAECQWLQVRNPKSNGKDDPMVENFIDRKMASFELQFLPGQFHMLLADAYCVKGIWTSAANTYGSDKLWLNPYANYGRAKGFEILKDEIYFSNYTQALYYYDRAIQLKSNYFEAYYRSAFCWYQKRDYESALIMYEKTIKVLNNKFWKHLLSPNELEYLWNSIHNIIYIHCYFNRDEEALEYEKLLPSIKEEIYNSKFIDILYPNNYPDKKLMKELTTEKLLKITQS